MLIIFSRYDRPPTLGESLICWAGQDRFGCDLHNGSSHVAPGLPAQPFILLDAFIYQTAW